MIGRPQVIIRSRTLRVVTSHTRTHADLRDISFVLDVDDRCAFLRGLLLFVFVFVFVLSSICCSFWS